MTETTNDYPQFRNDFLAALAERLADEHDLSAFADNLVAAYVKPPSERYDDDFFFDIIKPAVISLIRFKDDTAKELRYLQAFVAEKNCSSEGTAYAEEILEGVLQSMDDILASYDVQPYRCENNRFDARRQHVVKKLVTDNPEQVKTVAESLSDGYERRGMVVSKERVVAYSAISPMKEEA
ncbi:nucleotide exchange factor GrpE [Cohnella sp. LGH]|uniref:nucleotide exchange factor GrpE n=1 Tax=Cohnella sp. LGH TaxID=1619153 RepID=UPI001ADD5468|nr:nucleotide exchange factor GrpE [Cohnella sp. LGH]QTH39785.1 nucleotide exchange factor GrpE [Cohnella sp. LGH]